MSRYYVEPVKIVFATGCYGEITELWYQIRDSDTGKLYAKVIKHSAEAYALTKRLNEEEEEDNE
jgi:hypothetical protein